MRLPRAGENSVVRFIDKQDIEGGSRRRRRHGVGRWAAGAAATVRGGGGSAGPQADLATVPTVLWSPSTVPDEAEAASSYAESSSRTA